MRALHGSSIIAAIVWLVTALAMSGADARNARADSSHPVTLGIAAGTLAPGLRLAIARGYFAAEELDIRLVTVDDPRKLIAPLSTGQLAVATLPVNAALLQHLAADHGTRIVADAGSSAPGFAHHVLMLRRQLTAEGRFKALQDLKGLRIAISAAGSSEELVLAEALKKASLKPRDISQLLLTPGQQVSALQNGSIDAALLPEPQASLAEASRAAVRAMEDARILPSRQVTVLAFSGQFAAADQAVGRRFLKAYVRGVRDYLDALKDGRFDGPAAAGVIEVLSRSGIPTEIVRTMFLPAINQDGKPDMAALKSDLQGYQTAGHLTAKVDLAKTADATFAEWAAAQLGAYRRR